MGNKPTGYDLLQNDRIEDVYQMDRDGDSIKPRPDRPALQLVGQASGPTNPAMGNIKAFVQVTGTTPNKLTKVAYKDSDGEDVIISTKIQ